MEHERFDTVVRALGNGATRRGALGLLAGVAGLVLGDAQAKKRGKRRDKVRKRRPKEAAPAGPATVAAEATCASPGPSSNLNGCNFNDRDFAGIDLSSSAMRGTKFRRANLCGADLSSSNLKNAEFQNANLTRADLHSSACGGATFNGAAFCRTKTCNGSIRNDGCPPGVDPEDVCCLDSDCGPGGTCRGGACCATDLAAALAAATDGDTIRLCPGEYPTVNLEIAKGVTVVGAGSGDAPGTNTILKSDGSGRVLSIAAGADVELRDLRISGGRAFNGGGISNNGTLELRGVAVSGNNTGNDGGGIFNGGRLALRANSIVARNSARSGGGGIANEGVMTLADTLVENNDGGSHGGGILNLFSGGIETTLQSGTTVTGNTASFGGGIYIFEGKTTLQPGSSVTGNKARNTGGGVRKDLFSSTSVEVQAAGIVVDNTLLDGTTINNCVPALTNCPTTTN